MTRAARAALGLQAAVGPIAAAKAGQPRFRVGLNTGRALVGNIGSQAIRNFTAIGDTTNLVARLQTYAEPGQVVIGQLTYEQLRNVAVVRALGRPQLKGKSVPSRSTNCSDFGRRLTRQAPGLRATSARVVGEPRTTGCRHLAR